jgi:hypothetical protein
MPSEPRDPFADDERALSDAYNVVADFAKRCRALHEMKGWASEDALGKIMNFLMTELWDQSFSQTEIREAFDASVADMNRYAAGEERHSRDPSGRNQEL